MEPASAHAVVRPVAGGTRTAGRPPRPRTIRIRATLTEPVPDEPMAVVFAGPDGGRSALLGALLGAPGPVLDVADDSYLVVGEGPRREVYAYVPGSRHAQRREPAGPAGELPAPVRPARRVELSLPDPLLRYFTVVDAPDTRRLGVAGTRVLLDAARRGGAAVYVLRAHQRATPQEVAVLAELARAGVRLFLVVTPGDGGRWGRPGDEPEGEVGAEPVSGPAEPLDPDQFWPTEPDPVSLAVEAHRTALIHDIPALVGATWFAIDPTAGDTAYLRRSLVEWAGIEGLRRASENPPVLPGALGAVPVSPDAHLSAWDERTARLAAAGGQAVRQRLAIELAKIHLRCVQRIVFGAGCTGLPEALDRELHALSLYAVAECDTVAGRLVDDLLALVLAQQPAPGVRRRFAEAVRQGIAEDPAAEDLARVLLVTGTTGVAAVTGESAVAAVWAYRPAAAAPLLPPLGMGLSTGCYLHWHAHPDTGHSAARSWVQQALRGVELELLREVSRRFTALERALTAIIGEAVDHGILLR